MPLAAGRLPSSPCSMPTAASLNQHSTVRVARSNGGWQVRYLLRSADARPEPDSVPAEATLEDAYLVLTTPAAAA